MEINTIVAIASSAIALTLSVQQTLRNKGRDTAQLRMNYSPETRKIPNKPEDPNFRIVNFGPRKATRVIVMFVKTRPEDISHAERRDVLKQGETIEFRKETPEELKEFDVILSWNDARNKRHTNQFRFKTDLHETQGNLYPPEIQKTIAASKTSFDTNKYVKQIKKIKRSHKPPKY